MEEWSTLTDSPILLVLAGALFLAALVIWLLGRRSDRTDAGSGRSSRSSETLVSAFDDVHPSFGRVLKAYLAKHSLEELAKDNELTKRALEQLREAARDRSRQARQSNSSGSELGLTRESKQPDLRPAMLSVLRAIYNTETQRPELPPDAIRELDRFLDFLTGGVAERL